MKKSKTGRINSRLRVCDGKKDVPYRKLDSKKLVSKTCLVGFVPIAIVTCDLQFYSQAPKNLQHVFNLSMLQY
jgi:hypothetical protein